MANCLKFSKFKKSTLKRVLISKRNLNSFHVIGGFLKNYERFLSSSLYYGIFNTCSEERCLHKVKHKVTHSLHVHKKTAATYQNSKMLLLFIIVPYNHESKIESTRNIVHRYIWQYWIISRSCMVRVCNAYQEYV